MGYAPKKFGPFRGAERVEVLSSQVCLECGHLVTDHHWAGGGWHNSSEKGAKLRDHCMANGDTCTCRAFVQPHTFTRHTVR